MRDLVVLERLIVTIIVYIRLGVESSFKLKFTEKLVQQVRGRLPDTFPPGLTFLARLSEQILTRRLRLHEVRFVSAVKPSWKFQFGQTG